MDKETTLEKAAEKFNMDAAFLDSLRSRLAEGDSLLDAVVMIGDGVIPYETAVGDGPLRLADFRRKLDEEAAKCRDTVAWLASNTRQLVSTKRGVSLVVCVRDGLLVAFLQIDRKGTHIISCSCDMLVHRWDPHSWLGHLRQTDKPFYRVVKREASAEPRSIFDFSQNTVRHETAEN